MKTRKLRHKRVKLLKISKREIEMIQDEWNKRFNYKLNTIVDR